MNKEQLANSFRYEVEYTQAGPHSKDKRPFLRYGSLPEDQQIFSYMIEAKTTPLVEKKYKVSGVENIEDKRVLMVIPNHNRTENLLAVVKSFSYMRRTGIVVVDGAPKANKKIRDCVLKNKGCYIWIKHEEGVPFNKSDAMNIGHSLTCNLDADWYVFHDTDVILSSNFEESLIKRIKDPVLPLVFQCFGGQRVPYLGVEQSNMLRTIAENHGKISVDSAMSAYQSPDTFWTAPGAPGGSIAVHTSLFDKVGGYDADWYAGYGPEDATFLTKCIRTITQEKLKPRMTLHQIDMKSLEDVLGLHIHHEPPVICEKDFVVVDIIQPCFMRLRDRSFNNILNMSQEKLNQYKKAYSL